ncbi:MAG TPA: hypothetical protein VJ574_04020 [Candidatus Bathyarchaeia archaeon]|nr:hypothetical protein [Candidatus Bathyarchaeia archaeon]
MKSLVNREKVIKLTLFPILIALLSILTGIAGLYLGSVSRLANLTYPFVLASGLPATLKRKRRLMKYGLFVPMVAFIAGFLAGELLPAYPSLSNAGEWSQIKNYWRVISSQVLS